jgi:uncharacterized BrkB/YihY/UPF0761 family membrane protein
MKRLVLSIIAGLLITIILSSSVDHIFHTTGIYPPYGQPMFDTGLVLLAFIYRALFAILGAYVTATIAKEKAKKAVLIIGIIGSVLWLAGAIAFWNYIPAWYNSWCSAGNSFHFNWRKTL